MKAKETTRDLSYSLADRLKPYAPYLLLGMGALFLADRVQSTPKRKKRKKRTKKRTR